MEKQAILNIINKGGAEHRGSTRVPGGPQLDKWRVENQDFMITDFLTYRNDAQLKSPHYAQDVRLEMLIEIK